MANILIVLPTDHLGGAEQVLKMLASNHRRDSVFIFFMKKKTNSNWDNLTSISNYSFSNNKIIAIICLLSFIIFNPIKKWDRIYSTHVKITGLLGILIKLKILNKVNFVARESTVIFKRFTGIKLKFYKFIYVFCYVKIDLLICQTQDMKNQLIHSVPNLGDKIKIRVIHNPIDLKINNSTTELKDLRYYGDYIVSAGRLIDEKGFDVLISAFSELKNKFENLTLIILGEGKCRRKLEDLVNHLNLNNEVKLLGFTNNVLDFFKHAKLCVVSSRMEGFPNVLLQMMSQNNRVVSTKCAGGIEDIKGVFACETDSVTSLEKAIVNALNADIEFNRGIFDEFLKKISIENFVLTIESHLDGKK